MIDGGTVVIPALSDNFGIGFNFPAPVQNVTYGANSIIISQSGNYDVTLYLSARTETGQNFDAVVSVRVNGILVAQLSAAVDFDDEYTFLTLENIVTLQSGDVLTATIASASGGTLEYNSLMGALLKVVKVGE